MCLIDTIRINWETGRAKGAIHTDHPVFIDHFGPLMSREARNHAADIVGIAAAALCQCNIAQHADFIFLMKQSPHQAVERQIAIDLVGEVGMALIMNRLVSHELPS